MALGTLLTGGDGLQAMEARGHEPARGAPDLPRLAAGEPRARYLGPRLCPPASPALAGVLAALDAGGRAAPPRALIALDGPTVQASWDRAPAAAPFPMLSAWGAAHGGLVIGQIKTATPSTASTAIPALLPCRARAKAGA